MKKKNTRTKHRTSEGSKTKDFATRGEDLSPDKPGTLPLLMALASSVRGVSVDTSESSRIATTPGNLLNLRLNDPRIGITSDDQINVLLRNLKQLLPQVADRVASIPVRPNSSVSQAVDLVSQLIAGAAGTGAPTVFAIGAEEEARKSVENRWGKAFASKSSSALLHR